MFRTTQVKRIPGNPIPAPNTPKDGHPSVQSPLTLIHSGGMIPVKESDENSPQLCVNSLVFCALLLTLRSLPKVLWDA